MEAIVYKSTGKETGMVKLPQDIFGLPWNADLVHQVVVSMQSTARQPIAHTKTRGEVRGGGKKPWQQKGTGRARHGSSRSPLWVGGGVAHGPRKDKVYDRKINKKMKTKAFFTILSQKVKEGKVVFIESISIKEPKTREAKSIIDSISKIESFKKITMKKKNAALFALSRKDSVVEKSFQNIGSVSIDELRNINPLDLLNSTFLVIENPEEAIKVLESKM